MIEHNKNEKIIDDISIELLNLGKCKIVNRHFEHEFSLSASRSRLDASSARNTIPFHLNECENFT